MSPSAPFSDEELTALALAETPDQPVPPDAVPIDVYLRETDGLLPDWYMPPVTAGRSGRWRATVILVLIAAFVAIEAVGLCSTYGQLPFH